MKYSALLVTFFLLIGTAVKAADQSAADNTDRNERDRSGATLTPMDQSNSETDVELVAAIRRAIMEQDQISTAGKNVKVIANNGEVSLRGPVESENEKSRIAETVRSVPGVVTLDNQLEVKR